MKTSWKRFYRRVASVLFVGAATSWSSAISYAQIASDTALNAAYNDGWQAGDNGGFGFTPWNFDNDMFGEPGSMGDDPIGIRDIDTTSEFNQIGTAWRLGLVYLEEPGAKDINRAGRGLAAPLGINQTVSIVVDVPSAHRGIGGGYFIRLNSGGGCICYGGVPCTPGTFPIPRFNLSQFQWVDFENHGRWAATDTGYTPLFDVDKAPGEHSEFPNGAAGTDAGMRLDFTMTGADTYSLKLTPLDEPTKFYTTAGTLSGRADFDNSSASGIADGRDFLTWQRNFGRNKNNTPPNGPTFADGDADEDESVWVGDLRIWKGRFGSTAPIDWIEFTHFDAISDPGLATDIYVSSLQVLSAPPTGAVPEPATFVFAAGAAAGLAGMIRTRKRQQLVASS